MGIILNRRRVCGGKKEDTYIQDGLVFWLDGINKGNTPTAWTDLVGNIQFPYNDKNTIYYDSVGFNKKGIYVQGTINVPYQTGHIEVVIDKISSTSVIFASGIVEGVAIGSYNNNLITSCGASAARSSPKYYFLSPMPTGGLSISVNNTGAKINNTNLVKNGHDTWSIVTGHIDLGARSSYSSNDYVGKIYAIRIYNRQLNNEEMLHNLEVDNKRFNLGLSLNQ